MDREHLVKTFDFDTATNHCCTDQTVTTTIKPLKKTTLKCGVINLFRVLSKLISVTTNLKCIIHTLQLSRHHHRRNPFAALICSDVTMASTAYLKNEKGRVNEIVENILSASEPIVN